MHEITLIFNVVSNTTTISFIYPGFVYNILNRKCHTLTLYIFLIIRYNTLADADSKV